MNIMHLPCVANALNDHFSFLKIVYLFVAMIVRNFVAITLSRLQEKPVRLSTQHNCNIKSYTICKSKFPLKLSIAFQANPNHVLELNDFHCGHFEYCRRKFNPALSQCLLLCYSYPSRFMFLNPHRVILSSTSELAGSYSIYRSIATCFCNLN